MDLYDGFFLVVSVEHERGDFRTFDGRVRVVFRPDIVVQFLFILDTLPPRLFRLQRRLRLVLQLRIFDDFALSFSRGFGVVSLGTCRVNEESGWRKRDGAMSKNECLRRSGGVSTYRLRRQSR